MILTIKQFFKFIKNTISVLTPKSISLFGVGPAFKELWKKTTLELVNLRKKARNLVQTNVDLGLYHFYKGNIVDAHFRFKLLQMCTSNISPLIYYNLGRCYLADKKAAKAQKYFTKALSIEEHYPEIEYYMNKITYKEEVQTVPTAITQERFDSIAAHYVEEYIVGNHYKAHKIVFSEIMDIFYNRSGELCILDIGCGSGICAHFLRMNNIGHKIVGVDLSSKMLDIAKSCYVNNQSVYNELLHIEIDHYFKQYNPSKEFDVVLSIDSLCYKRDIYQSLCDVKQSLKLNGIIILLLRTTTKRTVEFISDLDLFHYPQEYIMQLSSDLDMELLRLVKCQLYDNVNGLLCVFRKV